ncbi:MAG: prepilin-type N-terminal cleavage/methylation domain-containing protein [Planctomycetota bacterium]
MPLLRPSSTAFTLIELLVVVAILALLAALLMPLVGIGQERAFLANAEAHLHKTASAIELYHNDYRAYPPLSRPDANNLVFNLAHPDPIMPQDDTERDLAKTTTGYADSFLLDDIKANYLPDARDFVDERFDEIAVDPVPVLDHRMSEDAPRALLYVFERGGRDTASRGTMAYDVFTHAEPGFEDSFELWCAGLDGRVDPDMHLHDIDHPLNEDNITVTEWR